VPPFREADTSHKLPGAQLWIARLQSTGRLHCIWSSLFASSAKNEQHVLEKYLYMLDYQHATPMPAKTACSEALTLPMQQPPTAADATSLSMLSALL
jgi:hypothetical protein